eukprot:maker-scaffold_15-snap-gene-10.77-mRNA-1 protein AED:0.01 eAED:0.01 QI:106/1/1/1/1/1/3/52/313
MKKTYKRPRKRKNTYQTPSKRIYPPSMLVSTPFKSTLSPFWSRLLENSLDAKPAEQHKVNSCLQMKVFQKTKSNAREVKRRKTDEDLKIVLDDLVTKIVSNSRKRQLWSVKSQPDEEKKHSKIWLDKYPQDILLKVLAFLPIGVKVGYVSARLKSVNILSNRKKIQELFSTSVSFSLSLQLESSIFLRCKEKDQRFYLFKSRTVFQKLNASNEKFSKKLLNKEISISFFLDAVFSDEMFKLNSEEYKKIHQVWCKKRLESCTLKEKKPNGYGIFSCENCGSKNIHYTLWRRKAQVDRFKIQLLCTSCRHRSEL